MADHLEPDLDDDDYSYFQRAVVLEDWWLIKCSKEFEGKRFGVAGIEGTRAVRLFTSSPIIKAFDIFNIQASDGIFITLNGFINKERVIESGFSPEICSEFVFGFPPRWEFFCNNCFQGVSLGTDINIGSSIIDKDGHSGGSKPRDIKTARSKPPPRLQSKSRGKTADTKRKPELDKFKNTTNDGDHGSEGLKMPESVDVDKDECKAIDDGDNERHQSKEGLGKAKSSDVGKDECDEAIDNEVVSPTDKCGRKFTGEDNVDIVTSTVGESLTSELKELDKNSKPGKKGTSKKSGIVLQSDGNEEDAEPMNHSGTTKVKNAEIKRKIDVSKVQRPPTTDDGDHGSKGLNKAKSNNSSKPSKKGKSKKSEKNLKSGGCNVVEPMNHSSSKVEEAEEFSSLEKLKRKIDFDVEVTPEKEVEKQKSNALSIGSSGQKRSRSGRLLVSALEFWRNQVPVYDQKRNLVKVREGNETDSTPSKGKGRNSPKLRR